MTKMDDLAIQKALIRNEEKLSTLTDKVNDSS